MRAIALWTVRQFINLVLWILRGIGGLLRDIALDLLRSVGRGIRRFVRWLAPWAIGAGITFWLIRYEPEAAGSLFGIAVCFFALWIMVRSLLPGGKKKK